MTTQHENGDAPDGPSGPTPELSAEVRDRVFVVIAAYNEASALPAVVAEVRERYDHVVVVDDGSSDGTHAAALGCARYILRHAVNRGQGAALQTGIEYALQRGAEYVVTFDADGQHRVEDIAAMVAPVAAGEADITLGSRFLGERAENMPLGRRVALKLAVLFTRVVNRVSLTDAHNGLRCFSRRAAERVRIRADRMAHASEMIDLVRETGLPFREVPVRVRYTAYSLGKGQSSLGGVRIVFHYLVGRLFD